MSFKTTNERNVFLVEVFKHLDDRDLELIVREFRNANYGGLKVAVEAALEEKTMKITRN